MISHRIDILKNRITEKKSLNIEDVFLLGEAATYIRDLEGHIAILLDQIHHQAGEKAKEPT